MAPDEPRPTGELPTRPVPTVSPAPFPEPLVAAPAQARRPARRGSGAAVVALAAVLVVVLVGSGLLLARMWRTTQAWEGSSAGWERLSSATASDLATARSDLAASQATLKTTSAQLATAQARITALANEKAQLGDTNAAQRQLADYQSRVSQAAGQVATALSACVTGQRRLIGYLKQADQYDAAQLTQFGQDVQTVCDQATDANTALQTELTR